MPYTQRFLLGFCGGGVVLAVPWQTHALLPERLVDAAAIALVALLAWSVHGRSLRWRRLALAGFPFGMLWSGFAHDVALGARLQDGGAPATTTITGRVLDAPVSLGTAPGGLPAQRFQALVIAQHGSARVDALGARVRLSWYGGPEVAQGDVWAWTAVLSAPWGYANPGGFDYERWLLGAGIQGTGYVRSGELLHSVPPGAVDRARHALTARVRALELENAGVLLALLVGDSGGISESQWNTLRVTGTVHLMVISGLHVSLAAAMGFVAGRTVGRLCPLLPLWVDVRTIGCMTGAAVAVTYVLLAGAGLPALRALIMSTAILVLLARGRTGRLGSGLLLALAVLLAFEPLAIHQQGFWLSFGAVLILYVSFGHVVGGGRTAPLLRAQLALSIGMLPLIGLVTDAVPWIGTPANLLAVPLMSLVVVPAVLLGGAVGSVAPLPGEWLLILADRVVSGVLWWLTWLAQAPLPAATGGPLGLIVAQLAAAYWLAGAPPRHLPALALCWSLPLATPLAGISPGQFRVIALDVGQGDAISVDTHRHRLLFDAGPGFPSGFETGTAVVVPSLSATGPARLDALILSHDDVDHVGGAGAVQARLEPARVLTSRAEAGARAGGGPRTSTCHGHRWRWDGVDFHLLEVARPHDAADNDLSCILLVDNGRHRVLIAGDISARVEAALLRALAPDRVPVQLMFAPHHGSRSSSSKALVRVLRPSLVLVSAGRGNRFGHPHPEVVSRYREAGARLHQTGISGALAWHSDAPDEVLRWRPQRGAYWRARASAGLDSSW